LPNRVTNNDTLLYDTGSTSHIVNKKSRFTTYRPYTKDSKGHEVLTAGGFITPQGVGTAEFTVLVNEEPITYRTLVLKEALYIPTIDTSLVSGIRHYAAGGTLIKERLYSVNRACCGLLDFKRHGFFLQLKGLPTPKLSGPCLHYSYPIEVQIPYKDPEQYRDYIPISPSDSEASSPDTGPMPDTALDQQLEQEPDSDPFVLEPSEASEIQGEPNIGPLASDLTQGLIEPNPLSQPPKQPTEYRELLELAILWHARLGHIGLGLLKKTAKIIEALPDFTAIKNQDFYC